MQSDAKVKVMLPHSLKPKVMLWADVSYNDMEEIDKMLSIPDLESILCRVLHVDIPEPRRGVLLELYVHTVLFCRERRFNREQTSALLSITKNLHQANIEVSRDSLDETTQHPTTCPRVRLPLPSQVLSSRMSLESFPRKDSGVPETLLNNMEQCFQYCSELLLCHSVRRPPFSINLFSLEEVIQILKYIHNTYIRHCNLYKYIFTPQIRLDLSLSCTGMPEEDDPNAEDSALPGISGPKSELRALIEMMRVSDQLQQRLKQTEDQLNSTLASLQPSLHGNK